VHVVIDVQVPKKLSKHAKKLLEELDRELRTGEEKAKAV
jgi:DnaJ-class molecular chaperone